MTTVLLALLTSGLAQAFDYESTFTDRDVFFSIPDDEPTPVFVAHTNKKGFFRSKRGGGTVTIQDKQLTVTRENGMVQTGHIYACVRSPWSPTRVSWETEGADEATAAAEALANEWAERACLINAGVFKVD